MSTVVNEAISLMSQLDNTYQCTRKDKRSWYILNDETTAWMYIYCPLTMVTQLIREVQTTWLANTLAALKGPHSVWPTQALIIPFHQTNHSLNLINILPVLFISDFSRVPNYTSSKQSKIDIPLSCKTANFRHAILRLPPKTLFQQLPLAGSFGMSPPRLLCLPNHRHSNPKEPVPDNHQYFGSWKHYWMSVRPTESSRALRVRSLVVRCDY